MQTELKPFFNGVIIRVVDDIVGAQVISFERDDCVETGDFGCFISEGEQPDERVDELLFAGEDGQVEHKVLYFGVLSLLDLDCHGQVHFVK